MRKLFFALLILIMSASPAYAELVRQKNAATYVEFTLWKNDGTLLSSAAGLDSEIDTFADGAAPDGWTDCTNEATEVGSTGHYYLSITQAEMNADYIIIQVKSSSTGAITRTIQIRTMVGDPLNFATTDDGGTINVTTGKIDEVNKLTELDEDNTTIDINGTTIGTATNVTNAVVLPTGTGAGQISLSSGAVTVGTNNDKTGYSIADSTSDVVIADAVWNAAVASYGTANTYGALAETNLDAAVSTRSTLTAANVWETNISAYSGAGYAGTYLKSLYDGQNWNVWDDATRTLTALDEDSTTIDLNGSTVGGLTTWDKTDYALSAAALGALADAVWDEAIAGHLGAGTTGNALNAAGSAGDPWSTPLPGAYGAGTAGKIIGDNINATISSRSTLAATDNIGVNWGDITNPTTTQNLSGTTISTSQAVASVSGAVGSVTGAVGSVTSAVTVGTNNDKTGYALSAAGIDAIWDELTSGHATVGSFGKLIIDYLNAAVSSRSSHSAADVWAVASRTLSDYSGVWSVASRTLSDYSGVWSVATRSITGLTAAAVADLFDTNSGTNYAAAVAGSAVKEIADNAGGSALTESGIADAVWNELQSGHVTPGSFGFYLDSTVSTAGGGSLTAADIWAYATRTLTTGAYSGLTASDVDLLWNELMAGHTTAGSFGKTISDINNATNGEKESGNYTGIENLIRRHGQ